MTASARRAALPDRRTFLGRLAAVGAALPAAGLAACTRDVAEANRDVPGLTRPVLRPWAGDIVHLVAPPHELPVAYVSMTRRHVYVDHDHRDRAAWLLGAHISVSTALWRIPLPGDPERQPVVPGDEAREFEELPMRAWDPELAPAVDDVRIVRGRPASRRIELGCVPVVGVASGADRWVSAAPFVVRVGAPTAPGTRGVGTDAAGAPATVREDFRIVGRGLRHGRRECDEGGEAVQIVSWSAS